jgi:DUF1009 family protein
MAPKPRRIGILAGGGTLPLEFARSAAARGELAAIVAIEGAAEADFGSFPVTRVEMGQVGGMLRAFRDAGATDVVIIGPAHRPDLRRVKPDLGFLLSLPAILRILSSGGDDGVLSGVVRFFEAKGFRVLGPADVAPETLAPEGSLTHVTPSADEAADIVLGFAVIRRLGDLDVGQAVVVAQGQIAAIEGAEGTDGMLRRLAAKRPQAGAAAGVLVKRDKPGQELRVDMPSIGPGSVTRAVEAGLRGIGVHAGKVLVAERAGLVQRADAAGLFVVGVRDAFEAREPGPGKGAAAHLATPPHVVQLAGIAPGRRDRRDTILAAHVLARLAPYGCGRAVCVVHGHVLAVEAGGEGRDAVIARAGELRRRHRAQPERRGVLVVSDAGEVDTALISAVSHARLAGIAICEVAGTGPAEIANCAALRASVAGAGLFLVSVSTTLQEAS